MGMTYVVMENEKNIVLTVLAVLYVPINYENLAVWPAMDPKYVFMVIISIFV